MVYGNGMKYQGQGLIPDIRNGNGILYDSNDEVVYTGSWKNNLYHGKGRLRNLKPTFLKEHFDFSNLGKLMNGWAGYDGYFL